MIIHENDNNIIISIHVIMNNLKTAGVPGQFPRHLSGARRYRVDSRAPQMWRMARKVLKIITFYYPCQTFSTVFSILFIQLWYLSASAETFSEDDPSRKDEYDIN